MLTTAENFNQSKIWAVVGDIQYGAPETPAILQQRADEFLAQRRPMYKRGPNFRVAMHSHDIVYALDLSLRQAQRILQQDRKSLKKQKNDYVTVEEFCVLHRLDEKTIRKKLAEKYGGE